MVLALTNGVENGGGGKQMRVMQALIVGGTIAFVSVFFPLGARAEVQTSPVATGGQGASSKAAQAVGPEVKDKNFDLGNVSKALVDEASRLSNAAGWGRKLQEIELDFNKKSAGRRDYREGCRRDPHRTAGGCQPTGAGCGSQGHFAQRRGSPSRACEPGGGTFALGDP
jgi:hypothetical protein